MRHTTEYIFTKQENIWQKVFSFVLLPFLGSYCGKCSRLCGNKEGIHFFGAFLRGCTFYFSGTFFSMIVTFCGHSDFRGTVQKENILLDILEDQIGDTRCEILFGQYGGFDLFSFRCGQKFKGCHPNVKMIFVTPYIITSSPQTELREFDEIIYPFQKNVPRRFAISYRNRWMIEQADLVIAFVDHAWGGAYQTYLYAKKRNKKIINLAKWNPN